jgi:hypothetical protein
MPRDNSEIIADALDPPAGRAFFRLVVIAAALAGVAAAVVYARLDLTLSHYDARAHLVVARRVIDSLTPGWRQLGGLWLPLPHLLNLVPVQWDWAYRSGGVAVAVSILSMAYGLGALARFLGRHGAAAWTAVIVPLGVLVNPNVLYLQSTPMTEPLLIGTALAALDAVDVWIQRARPRDATRAGCWLAALALVRYEGWLVVAGLLVIAAVSIDRRQYRSLATVTMYPTAAVIAFLCLSRASTGSWLVTSGFFVPENPSMSKPLAAFDQIRTGLEDLAGVAIPLAGVIGVVTCLGLLTRRNAAALPLALVLPALLPLSAFTAGHPYRIRYMVPLIAASWGLAGVAISRLRGFQQAIPVAALLIVALIETPPFASGVPIVVEAQREQTQRHQRQAVTQYLATAYDGTPILASMGSLGHYMQETAAIGLQLRQFLHEGNGDLWMAALERPQSHVRWILIEELAEGGDVLATRARADPSFLAGFTRVSEGGGVALYKRKDQKR